MIDNEKAEVERIAAKIKKIDHETGVKKIAEGTLIRLRNLLIDYMLLKIILKMCGLKAKIFGVISLRQRVKTRGRIEHGRQNIHAESVMNVNVCLICLMMEQRMETY